MILCRKGYVIALHPQSRKRPNPQRKHKGASSRFLFQDDALNRLFFWRQYRVNQRLPKIIVVIRSPSPREQLRH